MGELLGGGSLKKSNTRSLLYHLPDHIWKLVGVSGIVSYLSHGNPFHVGSKAATRRWHNIDTIKTRKASGVINKRFIRLSAIQTLVILHRYLIKRKYFCTDCDLANSTGTNHGRKSWRGSGKRFIKNWRLAWIYRYRFTTQRKRGQLKIRVLKSFRKSNICRSLHIIERKKKYQYTRKNKGCVTEANLIPDWNWMLQYY